MIKYEGHFKIKDSNLLSKKWTLSGIFDPHCKDGRQSAECLWFHAMVAELMQPWPKSWGDMWTIKCTCCGYSITD